MTIEEFEEKLNEIQKMKCETQYLELKSAKEGCPKHLYDTLSSFSNQDDGGIIIFGVNESNDFEECGVYDAQDLQKKFNAQCLQMEPVVRPVLTVLEKDGKNFVAAEIPGIDITARPCHYGGKGSIKGSFVRVGDSDEPMTDYEVYSYEAYRKKYQDDIREVPRASIQILDQEALRSYIEQLKEGKPNLTNLSDETIYNLMSITRGDNVTLSAVMLFSPYPQAYFPQLSIIATVIPGTAMGAVSDTGARFLDNQRIEGNIADMLQDALRFAKKNMRMSTRINTQTGERQDQTDYPMIAIREAILNALVHRDYSIHTEGMPIQMLFFDDRLEIRNPGGIYGRLSVDQLGQVQPDTRNPVLATALEVMRITENRYSGIPTIRKAMEEYGLRPPVFTEERGDFVVTFYKAAQASPDGTAVLEETAKSLITFCQSPRTRKEICDYLGLSSITYAIQKYVTPLVEGGYIRLSIPDKPSSPKQCYTAAESLAHKKF